MAILFYRTTGTYGCFSNFSRHPIEVGGRTWPTTEHRFQAMKFPDDPDIQERIRLARTPADAKRLAWNHAGLRPDWDRVRDEVMLEALRAKFAQHPKLARILLSTGDEELVEHTEKDSYWGDGGDGSGTNRLGQLLMQVRRELVAGST